MAELCRERGAAVIVIGHDHALLGRSTDRVLDFGRDRNSIAVRSAEELVASRRRGNGTGALPE
jgi:hypothetical protein